jgi:transcriptional regulator with XRE-family HTH domain
MLRQSVMSGSNAGRDDVLIFLFLNFPYLFHSGMAPRATSRMAGRVMLACEVIAAAVRSRIDKDVMDMPVTSRHRSSFGALLRDWRLQRRSSQLALATEARISIRHLSFLETGRAQPSREMVHRLAHVLDVPLGEQNALLVAAGFAPIYGERELSAPELEHVRRALEFILRQQEPYPAIVMDGGWNIIMRNDAAQRIFGLFRPLTNEGRAQALNGMRTVFHPQGIRQFMVNWEGMAGPLIQMLHREAASGTNSAAADLRDELLAYSGVPAPCKLADPHAPVQPVLTMRLKKDGASVSFFSTMTALALPRDIMLEQLRIECFYPADDATEETARRLAARQTRKPGVKQVIERGRVAAILVRKRAKSARAVRRKGVGQDKSTGG